MWTAHVCWSLEMATQHPMQYYTSWTLSALSSSVCGVPLFTRKVLLDGDDVSALSATVMEKEGVGLLLTNRERKVVISQHPAVGNHAKFRACLG